MDPGILAIQRPQQAIYGPINTPSTCYVHYTTVHPMPTKGTYYIMYTTYYSITGHYLILTTSRPLIMVLIWYPMASRLWPKRGHLEHQKGKGPIPCFGPGQEAWFMTPFWESRRGHPVHCSPTQEGVGWDQDPGHQLPNISTPSLSTPSLSTHLHYLHHYIIYIYSTSLHTRVLYCTTSYSTLYYMM